MNAAGKQKHRFHIFVFKRGDTPEQDVVVEHAIVYRHRVMPLWKHLSHKYDDSHCGWIVGDDYWQEHGMEGRRP